MKTLALCLLAAAGCQEVTLVDDVDLALDWSPVTGPTDAVHSPYVIGAKFGLWVRTTKDDKLDGWRLESSDEGVLAVGSAALSQDRERFSAAADARRAGSVELRVLDSGGSVRHRHTVVVARPDRVDALPHGPLLIGRDGVASEERPQVLHGGTATFLVQYSAGGEALAGHGALAVSAAGAVQGHVEQTSFLEDRDWLVIDGAAAAGASDLDLLVGGEHARTLTVDTVAEDAIARVALTDPGEADAHDKAWLVTLAETFDAAGRTLHGVEFQFTADGKAEQGYGDLYRYAYAAKRPVMLEATHGAHVDGIVIHSSGGFVDSTNRLGCAATPGGARGSAIGLGLIVACLLLRRRRAT